jgi:hypothetical protein
MIYRLNTADEQDDAAFRARLAPLASEVLPSGLLAGENSGAARPDDPSARAGVPSGAAVRENSGVRSPKGKAALAWAAAAVGALAVAALLSSGRLSNSWLSKRADSPEIAGRQAAVPAAPPVAGSAPAEQRAEREPAPSPAPAPSADMIGLLLQRGDAAAADGDIVAARLLFERAAALGSARAATRAGKTYDIEFLVQSGARGIRADQSAAAAWYRKAAALGDPEAKARLARIEVQSRP